MLVPLNDASVVIVPVALATSKIVPLAPAPPADVVPYRLPLMSMIRVPSGFNPLVPLNDASAVIVPVALATSNTVPSPRAPPADAAPYRLPLLSMIRLARGVAPLVPLNEASVVIVPLALAATRTPPPSAWLRSLPTSYRTVAALRNRMIQLRRTVCPDVRCR